MTEREMLKPCPRCGNAASVEFYDEGGWCVACDMPGCLNLDDNFLTEAEAIAAWDRRAEPTPGGEP